MFRQTILCAALAAAALASVPAQAQDQSGSVGTVAPVPVTGEEVYKYVCQSCHMADAKGGVGAGHIPALASNPKLSVAAYPILMIMKGRGAMPWFNDTLTPAQVAAVVGYLRTNYGNNYPAPVTAADVTRLVPAK